MNNYAKRTIAVTLASLGPLVPLVLLAPTATADATLVLFEHDTVQYQADLGAPGPGPGDQFIFAGDVFDRPGGLFLGTLGGSCTTLTGTIRLARPRATARSTSPAAGSSSRLSWTPPRYSSAVTPFRIR